MGTFDSSPTLRRVLLDRRPRVRSLSRLSTSPQSPTLLLSALSHRLLTPRVISPVSRANRGLGQHLTISRGPQKPPLGLTDMMTVFVPTGADFAERAQTLRRACCSTLGPPLAHPCPTLVLLYISHRCVSLPFVISHGF